MFPATLQDFPDNLLRRVHGYWPPAHVDKWGVTSLTGLRRLAMLLGCGIGGSPPRSGQVAERL